MSNGSAVTTGKELPTELHAASGLYWTMQVHLISSAWSYANFTVLPAPEATTRLQHLLRTPPPPHTGCSLLPLPHFQLSRWTLNLSVHMEPSSAKSCKSPSDTKDRHPGRGCRAATLWEPEVQVLTTIFTVCRGLWLLQPRLSGYEGHLNHRGRLYGFMPQRALHASTWKSSHYSGGVCYSKACDVRPCELSSNSREEGERYRDNQGSIPQESYKYSRSTSIDNEPPMLYGDKEIWLLRMNYSLQSLPYCYEKTRRAPGAFHDHLWN